MSSAVEDEVQSMMENPGIISCLKCNLTFSAKKNLYRHLRHFHKVEELPINCNQICGVCSQKFRTLKDLQYHMMSSHEELNLKFENKFFYSFDEFAQWKSETERKSIASYVLRSKAKTHEDGSTVSMYVCHRSGQHRASQARVRHKLRQSVKTGITCPSAMKVTSNTYNEAIEISVEYQPIHFGHAMEIKYLKIPKDFKEHLASLMNFGVPMDTILDQIQKKYPPTDRHSFITKKDLWNIRRDFSIKTKVIMDDDDVTSLEEIIQKLQSNDSVVVIYKKIGDTLSNHLEIQPEEFLLGFMNEAQITALKIYGTNCIIVDIMPSINQYGVNLTTIFVNDENKEILPVAIFFSSNAMTETFIPLFEAVKNRLKPNFHTEIFISHDTDSSHNAWKKVFQDDSKHVLFPWHVSKTLNNHLYLKVKDAQVKQKMRTDLKNILAEADNATFEIMINTFLETYKDEKEFLDYFKEHYIPVKEKWAHCYQIGYEVNKRNIKLDKWHQEIKYDKTSRKIGKRMDESLSNVLHGMAQRFISVTRGKSLPLSVIQERHILSLSFDENMYSLQEVIPNQKWTVTIESGPPVKSYDVIASDIKCNCNRICSDCNVCIHSMSCTCVDYLVCFTVCKHIHFVCRKRSFNFQELSNSIGETYFIEDQSNFSSDEEIRNSEKEKVLNNNIEVEKLKSSLLIRLGNICDSMQENNSVEVLEHIDEHLKAVETYLKTRDIDSSMHVLSPVSQQTIPSKKIITPRKRLKKNGK